MRLIVGVLSLPVVADDVSKALQQTAGKRVQTQ